MISKPIALERAVLVGVVSGITLASLYAVTSRRIVRRSPPQRPFYTVEVVPPQSQAPLFDDARIAQIERLAELKKVGILTYHEFEAQKRRLLAI